MTKADIATDIVLVVQARKLGIGRNPRTRESFPIALGRTVRFKPGKLLRDLPPAGQGKEETWVTTSSRSPRTSISTR